MDNWTYTSRLSNIDARNTAMFLFFIMQHVWEPTNQLPFEFLEEAKLIDKLSYEQALALAKELLEKFYKTRLSQFEELFADDL